jgi:hypothetical protein
MWDTMDNAALNAARGSMMRRYYLLLAVVGLVLPYS